MANRCINEIIIFRKERSCEAKRQLRDLYLKLLLGFGKDEVMWYGNLLTIHDLDDEDVEARGEVKDVSWTEAGPDPIGCIHMTTDTAWEPQIEIVEEMLEVYRLLDFVYLSEEPGCGVFINSDMTGDYFREYAKTDCSIEMVVDGERSWIESEYFENEESFEEQVEADAELLKAYAKRKRLPNFSWEDGLTGEELGEEISKYISRADVQEKDKDKTLSGAWYHAAKFTVD